MQQARRAAGSIEGEQQQVLDQTRDNSTADADIAPFQAAAEMIFRSVQSGSFNQADYSDLVVKSMPAGVDFNQAMLMMAQLAMQEHGMIVSVNAGKVQSSNVAIFDVTTQKGKADMAVMLDDTGKIVSWSLAPKETAMMPPQEQPAVPQPSQPAAAVPADANDFNDFEQPLRRADIARRNEQRTWVGRTEKTQDIADAAYASAKADLEFLRDVAQSEGCSRTVIAIDKILAEREAVYAEVKEKLDQQLREDRERLRQERRSSRTRDDSGTSTRTRRSRTREREETPPQQPPY
jgi:hypothetical protein